MNEFEMLLTILRETLEEVEGRMGAIQKAIDEHQSEMWKREEDLQDAESRKGDAVRRDARETQRVSVLCEYLKTLERQPNALMAKMRVLMGKRQEAAATLREAEGQVESIRHDLTSRQQILTEKEKACDELRKEWNTISELISKARATRGSAQ